jgi:hypothetical protein
VLLAWYIVFGAIVTKAYLASIKEHQKFASPHPVLLLCLLVKLFAVVLTVSHLYMYSLNGFGFPRVLTIAAITKGFSEILTAMLLIVLVSGWTV